MSFQTKNTPQPVLQTEHMEGGPTCYTKVSLYDGDHDGVFRTLIGALFLSAVRFDYITLHRTDFYPTRSVITNTTGEL